MEIIDTKELTGEGSVITIMTNWAINTVEDSVANPTGTAREYNHF